MNTECALLQIYGADNVFDADRLIDLLGAFETFRSASASATGGAEFALPTGPAAPSDPAAERRRALSVCLQLTCLQALQLLSVSKCWLPLEALGTTSHLLTLPLVLTGRAARVH